MCTGVWKKRPEVEEGDRELAGTVAEQRVVGVELDLAVRVVVDALEHVGRQRGVGDVGLGGQRFRQCNKAVEGEGPGLAELESTGREGIGGESEGGERQWRRRRR